jgi:hypothetical protein
MLSLPWLEECFLLGQGKYRSLRMKKTPEMKWFVTIFLWRNKYLFRVISIQFRKQKFGKITRPSRMEG